MTINRLTVLLPVLLFILSGCIFSPKKRDVDPPQPKPTYAIPDYPTTALDNYRQAYESRDTTQMKLVYDDLYTGWSIDQTQPTGSQRADFTKADEVAAVARLARRPSITSVSLQFSGNLTRSTDLGDPPGWATIQTTFVGLSINDSERNITYLLVTSGETLEFKFKPKTPDSTSPTDTTWQIVQWSEFYTGTP